MPVLRYSGDTTIGESLGNLGGALGQALDPRLRAQAQMLQLEMQQRLLQMRELQRKFGARDDLKRQYLNLPPNQQATVDNMIESGESAEKIQQYLGTETLASPNADATDQATTQKNIGATIRMTHQPYSGPSAPIVGPGTLASGNAAIQEQERKKAEATASGTAAGAGVLPEGRYFPDARGPGAFTPGGFDTTTGLPSFSGLTSGAATTPTVSATPPVSPAAQAAPASSGATTQVNSGQAGSSTGVGQGASPIVRAVPGGGSIVGPTPMEKTQQTGFFNAALEDATTESKKMGAVAQIRAVVAQIQDLQKIAQTGGTLGQLDAAVRQHLHDEFGVALTKSATAQQAEQSLLSETLPEIRQRFGFVKMAGPELQAAKPAMGTSAMAPEVLNTVLAQELAGAAIEEANAKTGQSFLSGQMSVPDYYTTKNANSAGYADVITKYNNALNDIVAQSQTPDQTGQPQGAQPPDLFGSVWQGIQHLFGGGGGSSNAAPALQSAPAPPAQTPPASDPNASTQIIRGPNGSWGPVPAQPQ